MEPLPSTITALLKDDQEIGGVLHIQDCSAIVKPEDPANPTVIRNHPKLKG